MVEAMLDLVKDETERIDARFLEPACGSGNFMEQFLRRIRKLAPNNDHALAIILCYISLIKLCKSHPPTFLSP
jgi:type I restriction-modification system DNA methylase subunit